MQPPGQDPDPTDRLETLRALVQAAGRVATTLQGDGHFARLAHVFTRMPPEDREVVLSVLEREVELRALSRERRTASLTGFDVTRPNPAARLYVRVCEAEQEAPYMSRQELMLAVLRSARGMHATFVLDPHGEWQDAFLDALRLLTAEERATVRWTNAQMLTLVDRVDAELRGRTPATTEE
jgi:hypothetical protein